MDLFREMKIGSLLQKATHCDALMFGAKEMLRMATINGAKSLGMEKEIGSIEAGKSADLILVDCMSPNLQPVYWDGDDTNLLWNLVYSANGSNVNTVMVQGDILVKDGKATKVDEREVIKMASKQGTDWMRRREIMIRLLDERFRLNIGNAEMEKYAAKLGADCAYFISADPEDGDTACYAEGIGEELMPVSGPGDNLRGYHLVVVKRDDIAVSTKEAYAAITPQAPAKCCRDIVRQPIETWKEELVNDFEAPIFKMHPELAEIKQKLYNLGAVYAAMSGSGSAIFGIFKHKPANVEEQFEGMFCKIMKL